MIGSEFQVDTYTADFQRSPAVAAGANGAFVVVWPSYRDGEFTGVFGQHYDSEGSAVGTEFQVNSHTIGNQRFPSVAARATGSFVVTWQSYQDGSGYGVFAKRYDSSGQAVGTEFQANSYTTSSQRSQIDSRGADEAYVVIWPASTRDGSDAGVFAEVRCAGVVGDAAPDEHRDAAFDTDSDASGAGVGNAERHGNRHRRVERHERRRARRAQAPSRPQLLRLRWCQRRRRADQRKRRPARPLRNLRPSVLLPRDRSRLPSLARGTAAATVRCRSMS
jgi:hypothetical protein